MTILGSIPVLYCHSIEQTLDFYQQLFQFVIVKKRLLDNRLHWLHIMHGNTTLMLLADEPVSGTAPDSAPHSAITLYFFVDDIQQLHHFIKLKHKAVSGMTVTEYRTQEFSLCDPEGNRITVGQKL